MEKTFDTPGTLALELRLPSGEILVETADATETHVELTASNEAGEELIRDSRIELRDGGGRQVVFVEVPERKGWGITWGRGPEVRIRVRCPHGAGLEVATASADVSARGRFGGTGVKTASGDVEIENGIVRRADGVLAGSTVTMIDAVRNLVELGAPLAGALAAASEVPARVAGRRDVGSLRPGATADVVVLDDGLEIQRVLAAGVDALG